MSEWEVTIKQFLDNKKSMTELQYADYKKSLIGVRIHLVAEVVEVHEDGEIYLKPPEASWLSGYIYLDGVPIGTSKLFNKGQIIEFDGTIMDFTEFLGTTITLYDPVIYK